MILYNTDLQQRNDRSSKRKHDKPISFEPPATTPPPSTSPPSTRLIASEHQRRGLERLRHGVERRPQRVQVVQVGCAPPIVPKRRLFGPLQFGSGCRSASQRQLDFFGLFEPPQLRLFLVLLLPIASV